MRRSQVRIPKAAPAETSQTCSDLVFCAVLLMVDQLVGRLLGEGSARGAHRDSVIQAWDLAFCSG